MRMGLKQTIIGAAAIAFAASVTPASAVFLHGGGGGSFHSNGAVGGMNHAWQGGMTGGTQAWQGGTHVWQGGTHAWQGGAPAWQGASGGTQAWQGGTHAWQGASGGTQAWRGGADGRRRVDHAHHRRFFAFGSPYFDDGYGYDNYAYNCNPYWNGYAWVYPPNDGYSCVAPYDSTY
jgi:hypothetical protein